MLSKPPSSYSTVPDNRRGQSLTLLTTIRNPSKAVRLLYLTPESTPHPFLSGSAAEEIAESLGAERVDPSYFFTEERWREHRRGLGLPEEQLPEIYGDSLFRTSTDDLPPQGTVGAVALDSSGCIASVTSTGGKTNKFVGRIGDTPHMGAGFWAEQWKVKGLKKAWRRIKGIGSTRAVGVSGTGDGDVGLIANQLIIIINIFISTRSQYFIRYNAASAIGNRMKYLGEGVKRASKAVVKELGKNEGMGGVIALDDQGNCESNLYKMWSPVLILMIIIKMHWL